MPFPETEAEMRSFLGCENYLRDFTPHYADLVAPLHDLTKFTKDGKNMHEEHAAAKAVFYKVKEIVKSLPLLNVIDYDLPVVLRVDASDIGAGAYLLNVREDGKEIPILFWSHKFSDAVTRWHTITQEAYAIFAGVNACRDLLLGHPFTLQTDHRNLLYMRKSESKKILAWSLHLGDFSFVIEHIPGKDNVVADALSRLFEIDEEMKEKGRDQDWLTSEVVKAIAIVNKSRIIEKIHVPTSPSSDLIRLLFTMAITFATSEVSQS